MKTLFWIGLLLMGLLLALPAALFVAVTGRDIDKLANAESGY